MTANRLSYQLDFKGPSLAVDTAVLVVTGRSALAVQALRNGECEQAWDAAGVNLTLTPALERLSIRRPGSRQPPTAAETVQRQGRWNRPRRGRRRRRLRRAVEDAAPRACRLSPVIKGSAVNSDGRSNGITAPNRWAQQQA